MENFTKMICQFMRYFHAASTNWGEWSLVIATVALVFVTAASVIMMGYLNRQSIVASEKQIKTSQEHLEEIKKSQLQNVNITLLNTRCKIFRMLQKWYDIAKEVINGAEASNWHEICATESFNNKVFQDWEDRMSLEYSYRLDVLELLKKRNAENQINIKDEQQVIYKYKRNSTRISVIETQREISEAPYCFHLLNGDAIKTFTDAFLNMTTVAFKEDIADANTIKQLTAAIEGLEAAEILSQMEEQLNKLGALL